MFQETCIKVELRKSFLLITVKKIIFSLVKYYFNRFVVTNLKGDLEVYFFNTFNFEKCESKAWPRSKILFSNLVPTFWSLLINSKFPV